ncbi:MAG: hypothetical protein ACOYK9_02385 [Chlamydiia bacterium]
MLYHSITEPPRQEIVSIVDSQYGFSHLNLDIPEEELSIFNELSIKYNSQKNIFGSLEDLKLEAPLFLESIGFDLKQEVLVACSDYIYKIANKVLTASQKTDAWFLLKSTCKTDAFDVPRWHFDGYYFLDLKREKAQVRFVTTLQGSSTIFCCIPIFDEQTRRTIHTNMENRLFIAEVCSAYPQVYYSRGQGVFFLASDFKKGAIHTEPPTKENRLFFSIVPCDASDLNKIKKRILETY